MKNMPLLQRMLKMGENKRLQTKLQKFHTKEAKYLKIVQPWQEEVSQIALQVNEKLTDFKEMKAIVVSLMDEPPTIELVNTAWECVDQMNKDLIGLQDDFMQFTKKIRQLLKEKKELKTTSGSGMSHK